MRQRTIKNIVSISGVGLHSGKHCTVKLTPAQENTGIVFFLNMKSFKMFEYSAENVCNTMLATSIGSSDCYVSTVEHLMAVLHYFHISNLGVGIEGPELPILDGSSYNFFHLIKCAGIQEQKEEATLVEMKKFELVKSETQYIKVTPSHEFKVKYTFDCALGNNTNTYYLRDFEKVCSAKTFCRFEDVEKLRNMGLIKGGTEENAWIYDDIRVLNGAPHGTLDFVDHKFIDFVGDIAQLGTNIHGFFEVRNSSHSLNNEFCRAYVNTI